MRNKFNFFALFKSPKIVVSISVLLFLISGIFVTLYLFQNQQSYNLKARQALGSDIEFFICSPGENRCVGEVYNQLQTCTSDGTWAAQLTSCEFGCESRGCCGQLNGPCCQSGNMCGNGSVCNEQHICQVAEELAQLEQALDLSPTQTLTLIPTLTPRPTQIPREKCSTEDLALYRCDSDNKLSRCVEIKDEKKSAPTELNWLVLKQYPANEICQYPGYGQIPADYDSVGARTALKYSQQSRPGTTIVFCYEGIKDETIQEVCQFLFKQGWVSMSQEDVPLAMSVACAPDCQFWNAAMLETYSVQSIQNVMDHENVHNDQANNDPDLATHVSGYIDAAGNRHQQSINKAYQSIIEGHAEAVGKQVGNPSYARFRTFYARFETWAKEKQKQANFNQAADGDWNLFLTLIGQYQQDTGKTLETLLQESGW